MSLGEENNRLCESGGSSRRRGWGTNRSRDERIYPRRGPIGGGTGGEERAVGSLEAAPGVRPKALRLCSIGLLKRRSSRVPKPARDSRHSRLRARKKRCITFFRSSKGRVFCRRIVIWIPWACRPCRLGGADGSAW
eukprot:705460-Prorocentrum_minimum.AAC.1